MGLFGDRLRELRIEAGLTQKELAERSGLSFQAVRDLEQGVNFDPGWSSVVAMAEALGVTLDAFLIPPKRVRKRPGRGRPRKP